MDTPQAAAIVASKPAPVLPWRALEKRDAMDVHPSELRARRRRAGIPAEALAERIGLGPETLRDIENGAMTATASMLALWSDMLDRMIDEKPAPGWPVGYHVAFWLAVVLMLAGYCAALRAFTK